MYPDAEAFNPDRWLSPAFPTTYREPLTQHPSLAGHSQFGFGRRVCQGVPVVEQELFLAVGGLAWALTARPRAGAGGEAPEPVHWDAYTPLLIAKPEPFALEAVPRGGAARARELRRMWEAARDEEEDEEWEEGEWEDVEEDEDELAVRAEGCESESDHDFLIHVRDSSPESSGSE